MNAKSSLKSQFLNLEHYSNLSELEMQAIHGGRSFYGPKGHRDIEVDEPELGQSRTSNLKRLFFRLRNMHVRH